jgi:hypothetical protein
MPGFNIPFNSICNEIAGSKEGPYSTKPQASTNLGLIPANTSETARSHRFKFSITFSFANGIIGTIGGIPLFSNTILDFFPKKCGRPSTEVDVITIHQGQDEIFRPGKHHHQPIEVEFYEIAGGGGSNADNPAPSMSNVTARSLFKWWRDQTIRYQRSLIQAPNVLDNTVNIAQLDGIGEDIWNYYLYRTWPSKVTPRDHDYTESAIQTTIVQLTYDKVDERWQSGQGAGQGS